jgi:predicted phage terminase large subunit-like protein
VNAPLLLTGKERRKALDEFAAALEEAEVRRERKLQSQRGWYDENGVLQGGLMAFIRYFWSILEPETPLQEGWAFYAIIEHLEAVSFGEITRLLINVSPGFAKSLTTDVFFPAWEWSALGRPHMRYLAVSYSADLTERDNDRCVNLINDPRFQRMYPLRMTKTGVQLIGNNKTGWKKASSVGGAVTGLRADRVICDDPHNVIDIESDLVRSETVRWFRESLSNRLNSPEKSAIIIIMQRLHELDVSGILLENDFDYVHLCIPMLYEYDRLTEPDDSGPNAPPKPIATTIGWTDPRYDPDPELCEGLPAWPERFPASALAQLQKEIGPHAWAGQYCQNPSPRGGDIIRGDWWQVWDPPNGQFPEFDFILAAADTAFTEKKQNDPSALTVWGCFKQGDERRLMLVDAWEKRRQLHGSLPLQEAYEYNSNAKTKWNGPPNPEYLKRCEAKLPRLARETDRSYYARIQEEWGLVEWLIHTCRVRRVDRLIIEGGASGLDAAHELERIAGREGWGIDLVPAKGDKVARALAVQPIFSQGLVYAPNRPFADMVIKQCEVFPRGRHDDLVDSTTHALKWLRANGFADRPQETRDRLAEEARFKPKPKALYSGLD